MSVSEAALTPVLSQREREFSPSPSGRGCRVCEAGEGDRHLSDEAGSQAGHDPLDEVALDEASRLAVAFQAGDRTVLGALYAAVRPIVATVVKGYRRRLPAILERADLAQETWLILAELAERWRPQLGSFKAYLRVSLPWTLARRVARQAPGRGTAEVTLLSLELRDVWLEAEDRVGESADAWNDHLAWEELVGWLSERERRVLELHFDEDLPFNLVAQRLGTSRTSGYRLYRKALESVRSAAVVGDEWRR